MIVDCHTHLSTNDQWGEEFTRAFGKAYSGAGIDLHTTPERHWRAMEKVDKAIVFGINSKFLKMNTPNDEIAKYARAHSDKIIGFMSIDPRDPQAIHELERCVNALN
jgi:predicted TIM-barrel fold metal-dependent hydrolase